MRILITGGSGFIGSRLVERLITDGHEVSIFDLVESKRYPELCILGDVCNPAELLPALGSIDVVYHLAAEHRDDVRPASRYYEVNVNGTRNLATACAAKGVKRIVFTSSVAIYGLNVGIPSEDTKPQPFNDYGTSKLQGEAELMKWLHLDGSNSLAMVRPAVIFGEHNRGNVFNLVKQIVSGKFVMVGNGRNMKSMGYVGNIAAFLAFIAISPGKSCEIYNYADKPDFSMQEFVQLVQAHRGVSNYLSKIRIPYAIGLAAGVCLDIVAGVLGMRFPLSAVRIRKFCASTTIAVDRLASTGFVQPYSLSEGLQLFLDHEFDNVRP